MRVEQNLFFGFDLDGTLTKEEILPRIAREFGLSSQIDSLTQDTVSGKIGFKESFEKRVSLLSHIPPDQVADVVLSVPVNERLIDWVQRKSSEARVVTGNLDLWVNPWLKAYGLEGATSQGELVNGGVRVARILEKEAVVMEAKREAKVVFVGDGANDAGAFEVADYAIAFAGVHRPASILFELANAVAMEEVSLCRILSRLSSQ